MAKIIKGDLVIETKSSFRDYAIDVISDRAIPSVLDGLKPIARKILYTMWDLKLNHKAQRRKVNTVAGSVLRFSVHGDASVVGAINNMTAWFKTNVPYIDGMGNFGYIDGSSASASRYIEAKLSEYSDEIMLGDIGPNTTTWMKSYDDTLDEPVYLPVKLPNLLINGCPAGIAVGYASMHVPHNPLDVINLCKAYVNNRNMSIDEMIKVLKGPDFPTGGIINGLESIIRGYKTGKGSVLVRGRYKTFEENGFITIRIYEVPYCTTTEQIFNQIAKIADEGKIRLKPRGLHDHTDKDGVKLDITLKKDEDLDRAINVLYKETDFETRINMMNYVLTEDKRLKLATLDFMVSEFIRFRETTIWKRLRDELDTKQKRIHLLDALVIINKDMDNAIGLIRKSKGKQDAKEKLMKKYKLDDLQAEYVVTMQVYRLSTIEIQAVINEQNTLKKRCKDLIAWTKTTSNKNIDKIMLDEWTEIENTMFKGYKRKTQIMSTYEHISMSEIIREDPVTVIITKEGYVKKFAGHNVGFESDPKTLMITDDDEIYEIVRTYENKALCIVTDRGKVFNITVHNLDISNKRGKLLRNIVLAKDDEHVLSIWQIGDMVDKKGNEPNVITISESGMIKSTRSDLLYGVSNAGKLIQQMNRGERLVGVCRPVNKEHIVIATEKGQVINLNNTVSNTGLGGVGVIGMKLRDGDKIAGMCSTNKYVLMCCNNGYYKTVALDDIQPQNRGGYGLIGFNCKGEQKVVSIKNDHITRFIANTGINASYREIFVNPDKHASRTSKGSKLPHDVIRVSDWR